MFFNGSVHTTMVFFISYSNERNVLCRGTCRRVAVCYWYVGIWRLKILYKSRTDRRSRQEAREGVTTLYAYTLTGLLVTIRYDAGARGDLQLVECTSGINSIPFITLFRAEHRGELSLGM